MVDEEAIGKIQSRRLEDGRVEVAYITASGRTVTPKVRYLPSEMPEGVVVQKRQRNGTRAG